MSPGSPSSHGPKTPIILTLHHVVWTRQCIGGNKPIARSECEAPTKLPQSDVKAHASVPTVKTEVQKDLPDPRQHLRSAVCRSRFPYRKEMRPTPLRFPRAFFPNFSPLCWVPPHPPPPWLSPNPFLTHSHYLSHSNLNHHT